MPEPDDQLLETAGRLAEARTQRRSADLGLHVARLRQVALQRERSRAERGGDRQTLQRVDAELRRNAAELAALDESSGAARQAVDGLVAGLHEALTPERLTGLWPADVPILLLPLRVETRYKQAELMVRV